MSAGAARWALNVPGPSPRDRLVLITLGDMAKDATMQCWPSIKHLCGVTGYSERAVQAAVAALVSKGLITAQDRTGTSNLYTVRPDREGGANSAGVAGGAKSAPLPKTAGVRLAKTMSSPADSAPKPRVPTSKGNYPSSQTLPTLSPSAAQPTLPLMRVIRGEEGRKTATVQNAQQASARPEAEFDAFWRAYPKKVAKDDARRAYAKARKKVDASTILAVVRGYRWNPDPQFVPYPASWLDKGHWQDEPPTPEERQARGQSYAGCL